MTLTMKDNIRDWQSLCEDQMNSSRHPLVDRNAALHQFYGYLMALQQTGFITEDEQTEAMKKGSLELLTGLDKRPNALDAFEQRVETRVAAMHRGVHTHGVPNKILVDNGREFLAIRDAKEAETKPLDLSWNATREEISSAMREVRKEQTKTRNDGSPFNDDAYYEELIDGKRKPINMTESKIAQTTKNPGNVLAFIGTGHPAFNVVYNRLVLRHYPDIEDQLHSLTKDCHWHNAPETPEMLFRDTQNK